MERDIWEYKLLFVIVILLACLVWSHSCSKSQLEEVEAQYQERYEELESKYYALFDDLYGEYMDLYYACLHDPNSSVSIEDFTAPDDLNFPDY